MNHTEAIEKMLNNLDDWRHLPKYQMERRADLFFGLFISQIVAGHTGKRIHSIVVPEFPFRHNKNNTDTNHTVNFDYVLFSEDGKFVYILELKTDANSVDDDQLKYLNKASESGFVQIKEGIEKVKLKTKHDMKYDCLFSLLEKVQVDSPETVLLYLSPSLDNAKRDKVLKIVKNEDNIITFAMAADLLEKTGGAVECHFATFLRRWNDVMAGSIYSE